MAISAPTVAQGSLPILRDVIVVFDYLRGLNWLLLLYMALVLIMDLLTEVASLFFNFLFILSPCSGINKGGLLDKEFCDVGVIALGVNLNSVGHSLNEIFKLRVT